MLSYLQQYVIYFLGGAILIGSIAFGVQTVRLTMAQKDVIACNALLEKEKAINTANKGTLSQMKQDQTALEQRVASAQKAIIESDRRHAENIRRILQVNPSPPNGGCVEMVEWAKRVALGRKK